MTYIRKKQSLPIELALNLLDVADTAKGDLKVGFLLIQLALSRIEEKDVWNALAAFFIKTKKLGCDVSADFIIDALAPYISDEDKKIIKKISSKILPKISVNTSFTECFPFIEIASSLGVKPCQSKFNPLLFRDFLSDWFKVHFVNDLIAFWTIKEYKQGYSSFMGLLSHLQGFFCVDKFNKQSYITEFFQKEMLSQETYVDNYKLPLQNADLKIPKDVSSIDDITVQNKTSSPPVTNALKIDIDLKQNFSDWCLTVGGYEKFQDFIRNICSDDEAKKNRFGEIFGSILLRDNDIKKGAVTFLVGPASTAKSTCLNLFTNVIGKDSVCSISPVGISERFALQPAIGKRANFIHEAPFDTLSSKDIAVFKALTSNDPIYVDAKYEPPSMNRFYMKTIIATNRVPNLVYDDPAMLYRIQIFPMNRVFDETSLSRDLESDDDFKNAFFIFALKGAIRLLKNREFTFCQDCEDAMKNYKEVLSPIREYLSTEGIKESLIKSVYSDNSSEIIFRTESEVKTYTQEGAYSRFKEWADNNGYYSRRDYPVLRKFSEEVLSYFSDIEAKKGSFYVGDKFQKKRYQPMIFALKK